MMRHEKPEPYRLVIGDKAYSSWSLRPWLLMRQVGIPFAEIRVRLRQPDTKAEIERHSPSGKVPALLIGGHAVWDSLAIAEVLAERHPDLGLWPVDAWARAEARSVAAEMHSEFQALRTEMPMDFPARVRGAAIGEAVAADIRRIVAIWSGLRQRHAPAGPFLFGAFSVADAMFAPVASRFTTYGVDPRAFGDEGGAESYRRTLMGLATMRAWGDAAQAEIAGCTPT